MTGIADTKALCAALAIALREADGCGQTAVAALLAQCIDLACQRQDGKGDRPSLH